MYQYLSLCCLASLMACQEPQSPSVSSSSLSSALSSSAVPVYEPKLQAQEISGEWFESGIEGPAADTSGNLFLVNIEDPLGQGLATIGRLREDGTHEVFARLPEGSTGNGIRISKEGKTLFVADYSGHNILALDRATGQLSTWVHESKMNQPNDLAIRSDNALFASDPNWSEHSGQIWYIPAQGQAQLIEDSAGTSNGIELSPDEKTLYYGESGEGKIWAYDLSAQGQLSNKRLFHQFSEGDLDGMRVDQAGALYVARIGHGTVDVISPAGQLIQEVQLHGENPTNLSFGGADGRTVYVTVKDTRKVESFRAAVPGREWVLQHSK